MKHTSFQQFVVAAITMTVVAVSALAMAANPLYMVVDLSGGPKTREYPVSFLDDVPGGGWTDEHKTTKLVLRWIPAGTFMMGSPTNEFGRWSMRRDEES